MNNNGDGKIPMIGQEKRDKWKKILPELLAVMRMESERIKNLLMKLRTQI